MDIEELKNRFIVSDDLPSEGIARLAEKALAYCVVRKNASVEIRDSHLSGGSRVRLVLAARLIASRLDQSLSEEVTVEEIAEFTGLPKNQAAARAKDCLDDRFAERASRGSYKARPLKVQEFLDGLSRSKATKDKS